MTKIQVKNEPPVCDCCERKVKETSSRPVLIGCDAMLCKDCWHEWYDSGITEVESLKAAVRKRHGEFGGEADLSEVYGRRANNLGAGI